MNVYDFDENDLRLGRREGLLRPVCESASGDMVHVFPEGYHKLALSKHNETMSKVRKKIDTGRDLHLKE